MHGAMMQGLAAERLRVVAVVGALKEAGVRLKNWKNFLNGLPAAQEHGFRVFSFGRELTSLPQCHVQEVGGTVPQFLVDACEFLSLHLHTEGLFRKTGSLSRIRTLRIALEQGEPIFTPPTSNALQPCDVATLVKQFLRELPSPLIPHELQAPLCRTLGQTSEILQRDGGDSATLLITALFPPSNTRALKYLCMFLRSTANRCSENRMEVGSLALVIAPNLLHCPPCGSKLTVGTEKLVDRQAEVLRTFITHADHIGMVPSAVMERVSAALAPGATTSPSSGAASQEKVALSVYRTMRRQRRRSVGEMFVEAFSKLKTGRTPNVSSHHSDLIGPQVSPKLQPLHSTKRKSTEDTLPEIEGSAKKRRSIHDLREESQPATISCSDEFEFRTSQSPTPSLSSVLSGLERSVEREPLILSSTSGKRSHTRNTKRSQRQPAQENGVERRRRSLRFFTLTNWSSPSTAVLTDCEAGNGLMNGKKITQSANKPQCHEAGTTPGIPVVLIEGPERVVVGSEVEEDPDLLNCSFVETIPSMQYCVMQGVPAVELKDNNEAKDVGAQNGTEEEGHEEASLQSRADRSEEFMECESQMGAYETGDVGVLCRVSQKYRPPRRSISLPDVTLEEVGGIDSHDDEEESPREIVNTSLAGGHPNHVVNQPWDGDGVSEMKRQKELKVPEPQDCVEDKLERNGDPLKRSNQRMSVAERVRRFNLLSSWLRPSRPPPMPTVRPQETITQRGAVRLRRQGARRFSRSVSHEGVGVLLQGQPSQRWKASPPWQCSKETTTQQHSQCSDDPCVELKVSRGVELKSPKEKKSPDEVELHQLLALQLHLDSPQPENQEVLLRVTPSPPQDPAAELRETPPPDPGSFSTPWSSPLTDCTLPDSAAFDYTPPLSADGSLESEREEDEDLDHTDGISPLALHLRVPTTRRRYRDSPRWPIPEIRIATYNPVQL